MWPKRIHYGHDWVTLCNAHKTGLHKGKSEHVFGRAKVLGRREG